MSSKISKLSEEVINRIAAGEVIESPASVVKELVENSLDAGSTQINVEIEDGGQTFLRIEDNGEGMEKEDALLSLERHATSKLRTADDLFSLKTMGFRGEALAAIAAVSLLKMKTSAGGVGTSIEAEGGIIKQTSICARNQGTTIEIRSLFFNLPARKKFLKSTSSCTAAIVKTMETISLAHPEIGFSLTSNGEELFRVFPQVLAARVETVVGVMTHSLHQENLRGFFGGVKEAKIHRKNQYLFINQRPIFSPLISRAVKMGYGALLEEHAHPAFVLFLDWPFQEIDINVHPQKKEVRFSQESAIFSFVQKTVEALFQPSFFSSPISFLEPTALHCKEPSEPFIWETPVQTMTLPLDVAAKPLALIDHYLLLQREGLFLMDLKGAYARVLYEALKEQKGAAQSLLWPFHIEVEESDSLEHLQAMGIPCHWIGKNTIAIDALPQWIETTDLPALVRLLHHGKKIDLIATQFVKEAKRKFHLEEAFILWQELQKCQETEICPLGKPLFKLLDASCLKKIFA